MTETLIPAAPEVVTPETVTPLRPSEALRLGRLTRPVRITGDLVRGEMSACALGAIGIGGGISPDEITYMGIAEDRFPALSIKDDAGVAVYERIYWMNDAGESDDAIVAYLEGLGL